jgi:hypothetical protein
LPMLSISDCEPTATLWRLGLRMIPTAKKTLNSNTNSNTIFRQSFSLLPDEFKRSRT